MFLKDGASAPVSVWARAVSPRLSLVEVGVCCPAHIRLGELVRASIEASPISSETEGVVRANCLPACLRIINFYSLNSYL